MDETPQQPPATGQWTPPPASTEPQPGPAGFAYADVPNRIVAYIIDILVLVVINVIITVVLSAVGLSIVSGDLTSGFAYSYVAVVVYGLIGLAISAGYFIYTWTTMRATVGMRVLGMQIGKEVSGATLTMEQAIRRWLALGGWISIVQFLNPLPLIGILTSLVALGYVIYLLYTTWSSPTKQGFHDHFAHTMVVKAIRSTA